MVDGAIGRLARIDLELPEQPAKADARSLVANPHSNGAILVVDAQRNDRALEPRVGHPRHRQQQFAGQESGRLRHLATMGRQAAPDNT